MLPYPTKSKRLQQSLLIHGRTSASTTSIPTTGTTATASTTTTTIPTTTTIGTTTTTPTSLSSSTLEPALLSAPLPASSNPTVRFPSTINSNASAGGLTGGSATERPMEDPVGSLSYHHAKPLSLAMPLPVQVSSVVAASMATTTTAAAASPLPTPSMSPASTPKLSPSGSASCYCPLELLEHPHQQQHASKGHLYFNDPIIGGSTNSKDHHHHHQINVSDPPRHHEQRVFPMSSSSSSSSSLSSMSTATDPLTSQLVPPAASALGSIPLSAILQRLPGVWYLTFLVFVTLGPIYSPILFSFLYVVMHGFFIVNNIRMAMSVRSIYLAAREHSSTDWAEKYCLTTGAASAADPSRELPLDDVMHVVIIPNYKEEMDTLCETLEVLASHSHALAQYKICLAMEATETGSDVKAQTLLRQFQDQFYDLTFTIHPSNIPGEVRGKSSNVSWAAREMARRSSPSSRSREILTVMDADTCFAQDYFSAVAYHYAVSKPADRKITMFAPCTVFDRNASSVPVFVRTADMVWSAGVMSNLAASSPIKVPCSAYSLAMDLAVGVGFWDTDPGSIGEDMHMYLKCFFATEGRVLVHSIASPASQCNIQGSSWFDTMRQRYIQSKRHMWGSLDAGYIIRRGLFALFAPGYDAPSGQLQEVPLIRSEETRGSQDIQISITKMMHLFHRIFEANMIMGQVFMLVFITSLTLPVANSPSPFAATFWQFFSEQEVHPYVNLAVGLGGYIRAVCTIPFLLMIYNYEKYFFWVSTERWIWSLREQVRPGSGQRVQPLGKRSQLVSTRSVFNVLDWFALPVCGILFLASPQIHAQVLQIFTDRLDYAVASKPTLSGKHNSHAPLTPPDTSIPLESVKVLQSNHRSITPPIAQLSLRTGSDLPYPTADSGSMAHSAVLSTPRDQGSSQGSFLFVRDTTGTKSSGSSRGDSGFYEFDDSSLLANGLPVSPSQFTPAMWKQHRPTRSTLSSEWSDGDADNDAESGISPSASCDYSFPLNADCSSAPQTS
ncbi:hypothetical protein BASA50_000115 [Batrachochytrium salamandrivorans]|uniref:Glycosyltransferase 2-like domain-containing protein n=1 Tax=Batrachochytrium salamandrivorans TaxID=1357716 RepID=A0ABQ8EV43_9FUNG|nr:hypothetical protein BASA61_000389 [Batrachochytrium salamandrivorans]KAH6587067.1 hypothetical protein BASA50_000115 [Batrachochytrium salamandrivorans]